LLYKAAAVTLDRSKKHAMLAMNEDFAIIIQRRLSRKKTLVVGKTINRRVSLWVYQRIPGLQITVGWRLADYPKCRGLHARSLSGRNPYFCIKSDGWLHFIEQCAIESKV